MKDKEKISSDQFRAGTEATVNFCAHPAVIGVWTDHEWSHGVQIDRLRILDRVFVRTLNSLYELTILTPSNCEVLVRGGVHFQKATVARVAGSSLGGSFLKVGGIYEGFQLELVDGDSTVITGPVQKVSSSVP